MLAVREKTFIPDPSLHGACLQHLIFVGRFVIVLDSRDSAGTCEAGPE